ncbi:DUF2294 domain-containing protein [Pantanalinema rosaneae CENA516]|uniref:DUF2294 domain-containing protein n=1 Tax=Pantanalinema rosaneae TaxID=1620701 RepID=UPI003D7016F1
MNTMVMSVGQLERSLSQQIQALYYERLGHRPSKVTCQLFDEKLAIVIEDSITQPEQLLQKEGQEALVEQVRADLNSAMQAQLKNTIASILSTEVLDIMANSTLETGRTGIIAVLDRTPQVRNPESIPKSKHRHQTNDDRDGQVAQTQAD